MGGWKKRAEELTMLKRLGLLIVLILSLNSKTVSASEAVRVLILPFKINALDDFSYLKTEIPGVMQKHLIQDGATVSDFEILTDSELKEILESQDAIRRFGIQMDADYVIWGSFTRIGQKFSLDAKMIESFGDNPPDIFFVEGKRIENLLGTVKKLSQKISLKLFKRELIAKVSIIGNKRIEADAIKRVIKTEPGDVFLVKSLSDDLKSVYAMGYFDDIRIEAEDSPSGKTIIFRVKEKPTIRAIRFKGNTILEDEEISENLTLKVGSILNVFKVQSDIKRIEEIYKDKNYHNVKISYNVKERGPNQAELELEIEEGRKVRIKTIKFAGNSAYTDKELKKTMKTSEKGFFSWVTSSGELNRTDLEQDVGRLTAFYHNNGYIQARVGEPQVEFKDSWIYISIKIDEGPQFKVGDVKIAGDLVLAEENLLRRLKISKETYYNRQVIRNDVLTLSDLYSDEGYAYAEITPRIDEDFDALAVNITYDIRKGDLVYFEKIIIGGNTRTRDKVIRREMKVYEQELYSGRRLKRGIQNLYRLDFFEDIKVNTSKGSAADKMILNIDVAEKSTGSFSMGGGYSGSEGAFLQGSISQKNLFGRAQILELNAQIGGRSNQYTLRFTEPWLFDIPLSAGFDLYNWEKDYDSYDKDSQGGGISLSYPVYDFTRAALSYSFDIADITNLDADAPDDIRDLEGENLESSLTAVLRYDSRNRTFNPSGGQKHVLSGQYSGGLLGGDIAYTKIVGETGWYFPLFKELVGFLHAKSGFVFEQSGGKLPDYAKFYLGGINSLRGFDFRDISLTGVNEEGVVTKEGGYKFIQFNVEMTYPLVKEAGVVGVVFFDTGNVFDKDESLDIFDLRKSAGAGFRWNSPVGPIRLEYGYILDVKESEDKSGQWEFSMGGAF
jgi:outer membrane protein insertion porin family